MWLSRRRNGRPSGEPEAETGTVTLSGESTAVYVQGERRQLPVYGPGGCCWQPAEGQQVLVLKLGQEGEQCCVAGIREEAPEHFQPGELYLHGGGGAGIWLRQDGTVEITGVLKINGQDYRPCLCGEDSSSGGGDEE